MSGPYLSGGARTLPYMASERFEMRVPKDLLERIDAERGHEKRASWIKRTLESALGAVDGTKAPESVLPHGGQSSPAPSRASVEVYASANGETAIAARDVLREEWLEPEPVSGCPECGGSWASGLSPEGTYRICTDCGAREAS